MIPGKSIRGMSALKNRIPTRTRVKAEPGAKLFKRLRVQLTFWYCGVLAAALLLFSIALYLGAQYLLFNPIQDQLTHQADIIQHAWQRNPDMICTAPASKPSGVPFFPPSVRSDFPFMIACYDAGGLLMPGDEYNRRLPLEFLDNSLALSSLHTGNSASDKVDGGSTYGHIYRYATVVQDQTGKTLGVIQVGMAVATQENILTILLTLLLILGGITLFGAGIGGLFLASRALIPARLAFARQQQFIADASHELRTPLTLLSADAEVLRLSSNRLDPEDAALLEDIFTETAHMSTLATNMLTLARLDASEHYGHREHDIIHLDALADNIAHRASALAEQQGITLHREQLEPALMIGDPTLLEQSVLILLDNALKYNIQGGSVTLRTFSRDHRAYLEVQDTGIGIASEHLARLGERFYRVDKARARDTGGTGLGLSIAHSIARTHNGTLTITSELGRGTTATLSFPALTPPIRRDAVRRDVVRRDVL